jgi:hypothetical protein
MCGFNHHHKVTIQLYAQRVDSVITTECGTVCHLNSVWITKLKLMFSYVVAHMLGPDFCFSFFPVFCIRNPVESVSSAVFCINCPLLNVFCVLSPVFLDWINKILLKSASIG